MHRITLRSGVGAARPDDAAPKKFLRDFKSRLDVEQRVEIMHLPPGVLLITFVIAHVFAKVHLVDPLGMHLVDPLGMLLGSGQEARHVLLRSADDINSSQLGNCIRQALELNLRKGDPPNGCKSTSYFYIPNTEM